MNKFLENTPTQCLNNYVHVFFLGESLSRNDKTAYKEPHDYTLQGVFYPEP